MAAPNQSFARPAIDTARVLPPGGFAVMDSSQKALRIQIDLIRRRVTTNDSTEYLLPKTTLEEEVKFFREHLWL